VVLSQKIDPRGIDPLRNLCYGTLILRWLHFRAVHPAGGFIVVSTALRCNPLGINAPRDQCPVGSIPLGINATWDQYHWDQCPMGLMPLGSMPHGINVPGIK